MSSPPAPNESLFAWVVANPAAAAEVVRLSQLFAQLQVEVVAPEGAINTLRQPIKIAGTNAILTVPLKFANTWAAPTGTATRTTFATSTVTLEQLAERVCALIQDLQRTGQAPTL